MHTSADPRWTASARAGGARVTSAPAWPALLGVGWLAGVLLLDADGGLGLQRLLGLGTWLVLVAVLRAEPSLVRMQAVVVVVLATAVEYTFSPWLEVYVYRFDNVPAYVPPGHGLVYLAALAIGRSPVVRRRLRSWTVAVLMAGSAYAAHGLWWADRVDVLGAFWFCCLAGFLAWGPSRGLYVGAFLVVTGLEVAGTTLGTWTWQPVDPTGLVPIGNPPSGAAGGYGWFDLAALLLAPRLVAVRAALSRRLPGRRDRDNSPSRATRR